MNAFAAADGEGKADQLCSELEDLFTSCNTGTEHLTEIPATFLRVTVTC